MITKRIQNIQDRKELTVVWKDDGIVTSQNKLNYQYLNNKIENK